MKERQGDFEALGVNVAAMSYDDVEALGEFADAQNVGYALLSDAGSKHVNALGIRDEQYEKEHFAYGVPKPGVLFIDAAGVIRLKRATPGYRDRPPLDELLAAVKAAVADSPESAAAP